MEIEIRVFERTPGVKPSDHPQERDIYCFAKTFDLEDSIFDIFDQAKMEANTALLVDQLASEQDRLEDLCDPQDRIDEAAKAQLRHKKYGDPLQ